ncbi:MAG: hypothetical protein ACW96S_11590 [Promethearchaeota archaeon]
MSDAPAGNFLSIPILICGSIALLCGVLFLIERNLKSNPHKFINIRRGSIKVKPLDTIEWVPLETYS